MRQERKVYRRKGRAQGGDEGRQKGGGEQFVRRDSPLQRTRQGCAAARSAGAEGAEHLRQGVRNPPGRGRNWRHSRGGPTTAHTSSWWGTSPDSSALYEVCKRGVQSSMGKCDGRCPKQPGRVSPATQLPAPSNQPPLPLPPAAQC